VAVTENIAYKASYLSKSQYEQCIFQRKLTPKIKNFMVLFMKFMKKTSLIKRVCFSVSFSLKLAFSPSLSEFEIIFDIFVIFPITSLQLNKNSIYECTCYCI